MRDPYSVLNIPSTATDDEVKQAYRRLAKKYHPDANPGDATAEKKMQEVNAAYDEILAMRSGKASSAQDGYGYGNSHPGQGSREEQAGNSYYTAARNYIAYGRYQEALNVLSSIPLAERDAEWYYLSAVSNAQLSNRVQALSDIQRAIKLDPGNLEYRAFYERLQSGANQYRQRAGTYQSTVKMDGCTKACIGLCICDGLFNLCCCSRCR